MEQPPNGTRMLTMPIAIVISIKKNLANTLISLSSRSAFVLNYIFGTEHHKTRPTVPTLPSAFHITKQDQLLYIKTFENVRPMS